MICVVDQHREVESGQVCPGCAHRIACDLRDIADLYVELVTELPVNPNRPIEVTYTEYEAIRAKGKKLQWRPVEKTLTCGVDPLAEAAASHAQTTSSGTPRVSGSREAPLPLRVDVLDLTMPARGGTVHDLHGDQIGHVAVASVLDQWVEDWREHRDRGERRPEPPTVVVLVDWLGKRLGDACDDHPAIDEFAADVRRLCRVLRMVTGDGPARPERLPAPCPGCDLLALTRDHAGVRCRACGEDWTEGQYAEWVGRLVRDARMAA